MAGTLISSIDYLRLRVARRCVCVLDNMQCIMEKCHLHLLHPARAKCIKNIIRFISELIPVFPEDMFELINP